MRMPALRQMMLNTAVSSITGKFQGFPGLYCISGSAQFIAFRCAHFRLFDRSWNSFGDGLH